ncbi:TatD family hydrolase [Candidatus Pacearchaeota archaeon]|nr:TatD family hydrolase [Candidatus Pacearchaeota archaeon]MBI2056748.1 TatD family hydrolase [Candidatus Pacearchaeota archaeon]
MFIDIHSHLDLCKNIDVLIENSKRQNVKILTAGTDPKSNRKILELKKRFPNIEIAWGIYPTEALKLSNLEIDKEIEFIKKNKYNMLGIGEVGIDLKENSEETLEKQKENLKKFVNLAKELNIPVVIHSRYAEKQTIDFLESFNYNKIIMHCFSGNMKLVNRIINNKWFLSIPANVKHSEHFQKIIEITPIKQLFCETDSPFLHPDKLRDNEPANVIESYKKISEIKNLSLAEVEKIIEENYNRIFMKKR